MRQPAKPSSFGRLITYLISISYIILLACLPACQPASAACSAGKPGGDSAAADALGDIGPDATAAVPDLIALLKEETGIPRFHVALNLGLIGKAAVPGLVHCLKTDRKNREAAALALEQVGEPAVPALVQVMKAEDHDLSSDLFDGSSMPYQVHIP
jgi:HEAT repeats